jgi:hypothetical protein
MATGISRETAIKDSLHKFQRRYRPIYISLVSKEEFLDIMNLETYPPNVPADFIPFSEDDWLRLKDVLVQAFNAMDYAGFIQHYFVETESIEFEYKCNDHVCTLIWWYSSLVPKNQYFLRPGAAMIREMDDCWIFILFSNDTGDQKTYEPEMNSLGHIIEELNQQFT